MNIVYGELRIGEAMEHNEGTKEVNKNSHPLDHTLDLIKAAFPYLDSDSQQSVDILMKIGDMIKSLQNFQNPDKVSTFSLRKKNIDLEGLLTNVRNVCYEKEREIVDMVLNMIQVKNMFQMYTTLSQTMSSQSNNFENSEDTEPSNSSSNPNNLAGMFGNGNMMELLGTLLSPEQKDTFESISTMFQATNN